MNSEELKKEFGLLMPSEINGFKRPDESIPSSNDFFLEIPQLISKDPVLYSTMNLIFSVILSNDKLLKQWLDTLQNVVNAQDWREVTDSLKGYMTPELKKKLDGIAMGANNYVHPSSHPASMIAQDATHRFVSDTEKNTWNGKASTSLVSTTANGLMPKRDGSATSIFTGDGAWKQLAWNLITGKPSTFTPSNHNHDSSYVKLSGGTLTGILSLVANSTVGSPADGDDSTKIANTAWVRKLITTLQNNGTIGGIVGGSLTQNGWVKYSNGLILQWGKLIPTSKNYFEITYPLSFTKFVIPLTMFKDGTDGDNVDNWGLTTESLNGCTIHVAQGKTDYIYYVAIGK
ncbi:hypothetical protein [uncultured Megamonas sp.]|uniref:gp53-like domain-containing protein n=1 Tax=uncultured Megamonas sp. TaxID=286140 RepID=UPI00259220EE|nr:hypothetical protein [uncultured Megamonas sp.]